MYNLTEILEIGFWVFILLLQKSCSAVDYRYEACAPRMCGNVSISYPFYIQGQQESFCGFPSFGVNCSESAGPMIHIFENDYAIDKIFYQNKALQLHNPAVTSITNCLPRIGNITEQQHFNVSETSKYLHLLTNCSERLPEVLLKYRKFPCGEKERNSWGLAMFGEDQNLKIALEECKTNVLAPVEGGGGFGDNGVVDYEGLLRRGFMLNWTVSSTDNSLCERTGGRSGLITANLQFACFCPDRPHKVRCKPGKKKGRVIFLGTGIAGGAVILLICLLFIWHYKLKKFSAISTLILGMKTTKDADLEAFNKQYGSLVPKHYSYLDIKRMTNSFKDELGKGGYGTVYKGKLLDGRLVAVKILNATNGNDENFVNEVLSISRTSHINIVRLLGFCIQGKRRALIFEYMSNGSLEKYIHSQKGDKIYHRLGMDRLLEISLGIARGLEYLHRGCNTRILHFDIKPHNILLDEDFCPKISDFGMAKQCTSKESAISILEARGTIGYIAPELISKCFGVVSYKSDVYSYGMMILEIVGRRKNVSIETSHASEIFFPRWAYQHLIIDKDLRMKGVLTLEEDEIVKKIILVGLWCIQKNPSQRPTMSEAIEMLEGDLQALEIPPKPFFDSPSSSRQSSFHHQNVSEFT